MIKHFRSENYSFDFNTKSGFFARWGATLKDDPSYSPFGPEILDVAVSDICHKNCQWCYRSLTPKGNNMSYETFKKIFSKLPNTVCQIAFSIGDIDGNPELWNIMQHCRKNNVIPNITINGERMTPRYYDLLSALCGAVAVSLYDKDTCYNAVQELTRRGMKQINIHMLAAKQTYNNCVQVIQDMKTDIRLKNMNAVVYLALKNKGDRNTFTKLSKEEFKDIVDTAITSKVNFGFDSCTAHNFLSAAEKQDNIEQLKQMVEPCESSCMSLYLDCNGMAFPCSFAPKVGEWKEGINVLEANDFIKDVWYHPKLVNYRERNIKNNRKCLLYNMELE